MHLHNVRNLVVVFGDQLDRHAAPFDQFDPKQDAVWMAEVREEATHVWSHKVRIAMFFSGMRHFAERLRSEHIRVEYRFIEDPANLGSLRSELNDAITRLEPQRLVATEPGEWRVRELLKAAGASSGIPLDILPDRHFLCGSAEFASWAAGKKQLRLEFFYRYMRAHHRVLMERDQPLDGKWNYDAANRGTFGKGGPATLFSRKTFPPDEITRQVTQSVGRLFHEHPGDLSSFDFAVTPGEALAALEDFIQYALPEFGRYQDAMWTDEPLLYHSRLSSAMNLKLLDPRVVIRSAEQAYHDGLAPIEAVEGFIRQILGWREYVHGVYWLLMPGYLENNQLDAHQKLPSFYWDGNTDMECMRQSLGQTLRFGYAHHIQRLMVTGLFSLLLGVEPKAIHQWYLAIYVDAVEWVELPNVLGMSQYADGGVMGSKPYVASGRYIDRMSNYCGHCRYNPGQASGENACPFTTLYWDFLMRHQAMLSGNPRMLMQLRNLDRISEPERQRIRARAEEMRRSFGA